MDGKTFFEGAGGALRIGFTVLFAPLLRRGYRRWGATPEELAETLPGEEFAPQPISRIDLAVTIRARPEQVWPWFVQLGCQRAGWYSYDLLDNGGAASARRILPEYQHLAVGDTVLAVPSGAMGFPVARLEAERLLVLGGTTNTATGQPVAPGEALPERYFSGAQIFYLRPLERGRTRLIFRNLVAVNPGWLTRWMVCGLLEPISFVMGRKMLLTIKQRAEAMGA